MLCDFRCSSSCVLPLCLHPCLPPCCSCWCCCCYPSFPPLLFLSSPWLSCYTVHLQGACKPCNTHKHTHAQSKYGCVLPSTDARRITVREITVNICSMTMMRLAERRRGEKDNLLCHLSLYGCLSYITPSLSLYLPAHLSLTHFHHLYFSVLSSFPSHPLFFHFQSFSHSTKLPPSFSFSSLSHSSHLSLISPSLSSHSRCQASFVSFEALNSSLIPPLLLSSVLFSLPGLKQIHLVKSTRNHPVAKVQKQFIFK